MRHLLLPASLLAVPVTAHATAYSQSTGAVYVQDLDYSDGARAPEVILTGFDQTLGTLQSVDVQMRGRVNTTITLYGGPQLPFPTYWDVSLDVDLSSAASQLLRGPTALSRVLSTDGYSVNTSFEFDDTFRYVDLANFLLIDDSFGVFPDVQVAGFPGVDRGDSTSLTYILTETFNYTSVPEPSSASLLGLGLIALIMAAGRGRFGHTPKAVRSR